MSKIKKVDWITTLAPLKGEMFSLRTTCEEGSPKDNEAYWIQYWNEFISNPDNSDHGWLGFRVVGARRA